jgi:hypothetical protein
MKKPYNIAHINQERMVHSHDTNIIKSFKNSVKVDEETIVY